MRSIKLLVTTVLPIPASARPSAAVREEIGDRDGQEVVGIEKTPAPADDAVAIVIGVAGPSHIEPILESNQSLHRVRRGAVHSNLPIPIDGHEAERGIDHVAHHGERYAVAFRDLAPILHPGPSEGIHRQAERRAPQNVEVHDVAEVSDVGLQVLVTVRCRSVPRPFEWDAFYVVSAARQEGVGPFLDPGCHLAFGGTTVGRIVLEPSIGRRIVRGGDDDAVGPSAAATAIVRKDRMRHDRCRRVAPLGVDHDLHAPGRQHLERAAEGRFREGMGINPEEERPVDTLLAAIEADGFGDRNDV